LVFPYKIAQTNGPLHYGVEYTGEWEYGKCTCNRSGLDFGITGYTIASEDTAASITLWTSTKHGNLPYDFDEITVLHSAGSIQPAVHDGPVVEVENNDGETTIRLKAPTDSVRIDFRKVGNASKPTEVYGVILGNSDPGIVYHSVGVNGATIADFLNCNKLVEHAKILVPDLVIIDGGRGHLNAAQQVFLELGVADIPLCSLAKQEEEIFLPHDAEPVVLPRSSQALYLVQRVRDEAHRFAITYERQRRSKAATRSALDEVPGIGPKKKRELVRRFGSVAGIRQASVEDIAAVPGMSRPLAERLAEHLGG
jgi:hypothetical protein